MIKTIITSFVLFLLLFSNGFSQQVLSGKLIDSDTNEPLIAANIQVKDTFRGTITNSEGLFELIIPEFPVTLIFRYIGYETLEMEFFKSESNLEISLNPVSVELEEIIFTGENPAISIMERVILRKQLWRQELDSWKADSYTRQNLSNNDGIVSITESASTTWWHRDMGFREVITDRRQTNNILPNQNFAGSSYLPNFYDDEITLAGFRVIGVTHPNALRYYDFKITGTRYLDDQIVYDMDVIPKTRLQPVFEGSISVLGEEYALLEVNLIPGDAIFFPPPIREFDLTYSQQFNNYGGPFWLPTDIRINGMISIGIIGLSIPNIIFSQSASISNYEVNIPVPDSLYQRQTGQIVRINRADSLRTAFPERIPLNQAEREAYETIDSTKTLEKAFEPTGFLARAVQVNEGNESSGGRSWLPSSMDFSPDLRYNRVDALALESEIGYRVSPRLRLHVSGGYNFGQEFISYGGGYRFRFGFRNRWETNTNYSYNTHSRTPSIHFTRFMNSAVVLFGGNDYFDYYLSEKVDINLKRRRAVLEILPTVGFIHERPKSLDAVTNYSIPGGFIQRPNPALDGGLTNRLYAEFSAGDESVPFGVVGSTNLTIRIDYSNDALIPTDHDFTRVSTEANLRINTFLQRRFFPNTLDIKLIGFVSDGYLPNYLFGALDGGFSYFTPFGGFKSLPTRQLEGQHGLAVFWEHNFRTVPFELLGLYGLARKSTGLILFGSSGRTWIDDNRLENTNPFFSSYNDSWRHEIGIGLNNLFGFLRIDATYRLDQPGFYLGISTPRIF